MLRDTSCRLAVGTARAHAIGSKQPQASNHHIAVRVLRRPSSRKETPRARDPAITPILSEHKPNHFSPTQAFAIASDETVLSVIARRDRRRPRGSSWRRCRSRVLMDSRVIRAGIVLRCSRPEKPTCRAAYAVFLGCGLRADAGCWRSRAAWRTLRI